MDTETEIPVTVLSGSLGAGKTTLVNHVLREMQDREGTVAVAVNDMGELNVDADLLEDGLQADGEMIELSDGCICCQLRGELVSQTAELAMNHDFDHLLVESSGVSEPHPVAEAFTTSRSRKHYRLDTMATVVDADVFHGVVEHNEATAESEAFQLDTAETTKPIEDILMDQIEFSNVLVVNKADLVDEEELGFVVEVLRELKPDARITTTTYGEVDPDVVLDTGLFDTETAGDSAGWMKKLTGADREHGEAEEGQSDEDADTDGHGHDALNEGDGDSLDHDGHGDGDADGHDHSDVEAHHHDHEQDHDQGALDEGHDHRHPDERYGISSFVYRRSAAFHPRRLKEFLDSLPDSVVRVKGFVWLPVSDELSVSVNVAGDEHRLAMAGKWIAELPESKQKEMLDDNPVLREEWHPDHGDRGAQLVFIGSDMDEEALIERLDDCALTDDERGRDWSEVESPVDITPF